MPNRILREGILSSERVNSLSWEAEVFYRRLMSVVDDFGRFTAHPSLLRAALYPLKLDTVRDANMERLLADVEQASLVRVYEVAGKRYLEMTDFRQQVRAKESKYPHPVSDDAQIPSKCVADDKQVKSDAHVDGGGGGGESVDEDDTPPPSAQGSDPNVDPFRMHADWKPSSHIPTLARQSGLVIRADDKFEIALGEFIAYWLSQPLTRTQHEWDHAFVKNLKADKLRSTDQKQGGRVPRIPPAAENFEQRQYGQTRKM